MTNSIEKHVMLISGTSRGIGRAMAEHYVNQGNIVCGFSRTPSDVDLPNYYHYLGNNTDERFIVSMLKDIFRNFGKVDSLINNAGIAAMNHSLLTPISAVEKILHTNVLGTFLLCREAAKLMKKNNFGRIINFSTIAVPLQIAGESIYAASKAAVNTLTQILAKEFADFNITVNAVSPNPIATDLIKGVANSSINQLIDQQAIKRLGTVADVINVIDFYLQASSNFITGQQILLGGIS